MTNRVGQQLGNYRLIRMLGRGGFAEVYLGEHQHLRAPAAIKVLYTRLSDYDAQAFLTEARTIAKLEHPHIVGVLDFDVQEGIAFLVMSYAPNGNLRQRHPKGNRLSLDTIVHYAKQVAAALQYAHEKKLIHRDIKPENMLLGRHDKVLLSDFGIAVVAQSSHLQSTQEVIGTAAYMAPEQLQGKPRRASDQYSLGIVVYEWICGERPFHGSFTELYSQHLFVPPPSLYKKVPAILPDVEKVVLTALEKDPHKRFASVQAFAAALEQASQGGLSARAVLPPESTRQSQPLAQPHLVAGTSPVLSLQPTNMVTPPSQSLPPTKAVTPPAEVSSLATRESVLSSETQLPEYRLSRRMVVTGLAGLVVAGGGLTWLALLLRSYVSSSPSLSVATFSSHHPLQPLGTRFYSRYSQGNLYDIAWSPNGSHIAAAVDWTVQVWDATDESHLFTYKGHSGTFFVYAVAWSPDSVRIASGSDDKTVQLWDATDGGHEFVYQGHTATVYAVAWSPNGIRIASGDTAGIVQVWDTADGSHVLTYHGHYFPDSYHSSQVNSVAWSPDGTRIASGSYDNTAQIWNASDGQHVFTYRGHSTWVSSVAWSPNGIHIASASGDGTVQVWNAADGSHVFTYRGHSSYVTSVAWSPNGTRIASASSDWTVQAWNATDGSHVFTYRGHSKEVISAIRSPDGTRIASAGTDWTVQVWQAV